MPRELGFNGGQYTTKSHFGKVSDDFMMDEVKCKGNEEKLLDCNYKTEDDCGGKEGLGVICKTKRVRLKRPFEILESVPITQPYSNLQTLEHVCHAFMRSEVKDIRYDRTT